MLTTYRSFYTLVLSSAVAAACLESAAHAETARLEQPSSMKNVTDLLRGSATATSTETDLHSAGVLCTRSKQPPYVLTISDIQLGTVASSSGLAAGDTILQVEKNSSEFFVTVNRSGKVYRADLIEHVNASFRNQQQPVFGDSSSTRIGADRQSRQGFAGGHGLRGERGGDGMAATAPNRVPTLNYNQMVAKYGNITSRFCDLRIARFNDPTNQMLQDQLAATEAQMSDMAESNGGRWHAIEYYGPHNRPWPNNQPDPRYLLNAGVRLFAIGDVQNAKRLFLEVARFAPNNSDALFNLGALAERENNLPEATVDYQKAASLQTDMHNMRPEIDAQMALRNVGQVPILFEGGIDIGAPHYRGLKRQGVCSICRIMRDAVMDGH